MEDRSLLARERSAWVWLTALVVIFGAYFTAVSTLLGVASEVDFATRIGWLTAALGTLAGVVGIDRMLVRLREPAQAGQRDERDRLIELRSASVAYYVLIVGMIVVGCVMPFGAGGWEIVNAALLALAVAEIVHQALVVVGYRFGWHVD